MRDKKNHGYQGVMFNYGNEENMKVTIPSEVNTDKDKISWLYRAVELLRLEHNEMGSKFRYKVISKNEWDTYAKEHTEKEMTLFIKISSIKKDLKDDNTYKINLKEIFSDS